MPRNEGASRRGFLRGAGVAAGTLVLGGCDALSQAPWFRNILFSAERLTIARAARGARVERSRARVHGGRSLAEIQGERQHVARRSRLRQRWRRTALPTGAQGGRAGRDAGRVFARRSARHAVAHADHPPRLRRGLELHRQMEGRAARPCARAGEAEAGGALSRLPLRRRAGEDARRLRPLLREHRPRRRLSPADDPRLRDERRRCCRSRTARRSGSGSSASSATRWRNT